MHAVLLVVLTYAYANFSRSLAKKETGRVAKCAEKNTSVNSEKGWPMCLFAVELS